MNLNCSHPGSICAIVACGPFPLWSQVGKPWQIFLRPGDFYHHGQKSEDPRKHLRAFSALELSVDASKNHVFLFTNTNININIKTKTNTPTQAIFFFFRRSRPPSMSLQTLFLTQSGIPSNKEYFFKCICDVTSNYVSSPCSGSLVLRANCPFQGADHLLSCLIRSQLGSRA